MRRTIILAIAGILVSSCSSRTSRMSLPSVEAGPGAPIASNKNPVPRYVYASFVNILYIIDESSLAIVKTINEGSAGACPSIGIYQMALAPDEQNLYIEGLEQSLNGVSQVNTSQNAVTEQFSFPNAGNLVVSPDSQHLYDTFHSNAGQEVQIFDVPQQSLTSIPLPSSDPDVRDIAVDPATGNIYVNGDDAVVPSQITPAIYTVNPTTQSVNLAHQYPFTSLVEQIGFDPSGTTLFEAYLPAGAPEEILAVDPSTFTQKFQITNTAQELGQFVVSRDGKIYVSALSHIKVYSTVNGALLHDYDLSKVAPGGVKYIAISSDGQSLFATIPTYKTDQILDINTTTGQQRELVLNPPPQYIGLGLGGVVVAQ